MHSTCRIQQGGITLKKKQNQNLADLCYLYVYVYKSCVHTGYKTDLEVRHHILVDLRNQTKAEISAYWAYMPSVLQWSHRSFFLQTYMYIQERDLESFRSGFSLVLSQVELPLPDRAPNHIINEDWWISPGSNVPKSRSLWYITTLGDSESGSQLDGGKPRIPSPPPPLWWIASSLGIAKESRGHVRDNRDEGWG